MYCYKIKIENKSCESIKFYFYIIFSRDIYFHQQHTSFYRLEKHHVIKEKINTKLNLELRKK
jgi:hypothetical protein